MEPVIQTSSQTAFLMFVMAGTTYLIRVIPMLVFRRPIRSQFIQSFLYYVPCAVLTTMTIPAIFQTGLPPASGAAGFLAALISAWKGRSLVETAALAAAAAWLVSAIGCLG